MALGTRFRPDGSELPGAVVFNGTAWQPRKIGAPAKTTSTDLVAQDCSGPMHCLAIFHVQLFATSRWLVESWNGHRWHTVAKVPWSAKRYVSAVVCADSRRCLVSLDAHHAFVRTRSAWRQVHVPAADGSFGVVAGSCGATDDCMLAEVQRGTRLAVVHWNGRSFGRVSVTGVHVHHFLDIGRVSCRAPQACVLSGSDDGVKAAPLIARWDGKHWMRITIPSSVTGALIDGSCTHSDGCHFAGFATPKSEYGTHPYLLSHVGGKWIVRHRHVFALDCAGAAMCAASVPGNGGWSIIRLAGSSWHGAKVPNPAGYEPTIFSAINCTSSTCVAAGDTDKRRSVVFAHLTANGWRVQQVAGLGGDRGQLNSVSCGTPQDCWAGGAVTSGFDPLLYHYDGSNWQRDAASTGSSHLESIDGVSCVSTTFCMALGDQGGGAEVAVDKWNGTAWTAQDINASNFFPRDISCTSATFCLAVGRASFGENGMRWDGSTWHATSGPDLDRVSCVSSTFCMATGRALSSSDPDTIAVWNGSTWTSRNYLHPSSPWELNAVSCVAVNSCTVAGAVSTDSRPYWLGFSETLSGGNWHVNTAAARGDFDEFIAVSCPSTKTCHALGDFNRDDVNHLKVPIVAALHQ